ncbi:T9SS type A sorting domain-containing protein [Hymenobacter sp. 5317J-9]|uniref:T9SS type A sorting domain-containing protein n=1 Tax=Hymenobacter sp. 5317J-9 TaxID=2932250 RepID=UPI001FD66EB7|nr:T9SS type A sorting domain-containing protein [Hymenobacter sp. 5317J-9]UOQ98660.1 T9SS type A sorting domain-containing protein [Hymenobacter sp. 5317J-9]
MLTYNYSRTLAVAGALLASLVGGTAAQAAPLAPASLTATTSSLTVMTGAAGTATITPATLSPVVSGCSQTTQLVSLVTGQEGSMTVSQPEGGGSKLNIAAPAGQVFTSVDYANYGTTSGCSAPTSKAVVEAYLLGNNSASIPVENSTFGGDPCYGVFPKSLYVTASYGQPAVASLTLTPGTYTVKLTVSGCGETTTSTSTVTVVNAACGPHGDKINLCHNGHQICVAQSAVAAHLAHGDSYGDCSAGGASLMAANTATTESSAIKASSPEMLVQTSPNPATSGQFQVHVQATATGPVQVNLFDMQGHLVTQVFNGQLAAGEQRDFAVNRPELRQGLYLVRIQNGQQSSSVRLEVQK